jgi:deoxyribodipyrimidine photo-lyase
MTNLCWLRRDLRLHDHHALAKALEAGPTLVAFIFDAHILNKLKNKTDRRVTFIYDSLKEIESTLQKHGSSLIIRFGLPEDLIPEICQEFAIKKVFTNRDYEPYAKNRDELVSKKLEIQGIEFETFKDSVAYEKHELLTGAQTIYKVFTPYKNKWLEKFETTSRMVPEYKTKLQNLKNIKLEKKDWHQEIGFKESPPLLPGGTTHALKRLKDFSHFQADYKVNRDFPAIDGTSNLSVYLRFGNISVRDMIRNATDSTWLSEIIWRDFYQMILDSHPQVIKESFKKDYDKIIWSGSEADFLAWCTGTTGFPIIDAAMRCLNATGMMHNRLRMIVASFLCKILLVDWRLGERYFAEHLLDFDLAANNGGWQWSSSSGCDAQPYFRIFNPYTQSEKFDSEGNFIRQWIPELSLASNKEIHRPDFMLFPEYFPPIVSYETNRVRCLAMYAAALPKFK